MKNSFSFFRPTHLRGWIFLIIAVFFLSFIISVVLQAQSNFFQLSQEFSHSIFKDYRTDEIRSKEKINGEFLAAYDNLGIIEIRFNTYNRINNDVLIFRIKEAGRKDWQYENTYKTDQFQNNQFFPFGFPPIHESQGKMYQFEIVSTRGRRGDAVTISSENPAVRTTYQYSAQLLLSDPFKVPGFLLEKSFESLKDREARLILLAPFLFALVLYLPKTRQITKYFFFAWIGLVFLYIFLAGKYLPGDAIESTGITLLLIGLWILFLIRENLESIFSFIISAGLLVLSSLILLIIDRPDIAQRSANLAYLLLVVGVVMGLIENMRASKKIQYLQFLENIIDTKKLTTGKEKVFLTLTNIKNNYQQRPLKEKIVLLLGGVCMGVLLLFALNAGSVLLRALQQENAILSATPVINSVEPHIAYYGTKVVIKGQNFGEPPRKNTFLRNNGEDVFVDFWSGSKIIFTIPLHWKLGDNKLWVEKKVSMFGKERTLKSESKVLRLIDRADAWSEEDDQYFKQFENFDAEVRKLNGH